MLKHFSSVVSSYNRFVELQASIITILVAYLLLKNNEETGAYIVYSISLKACSTRRIFRHKVFANIAKCDKHSMGWFFWC